LFLSLSAQTVDEIVAKHIAAQGGMAVESHSEYANDGRR
jgi:hypothetical protein